MDSLIATQVRDQATELDRVIRDHQDGRAAAAEAGYRRILARDPDQPDAWHLLGMLACDRGDAPTALSLVDIALGLDPDRAAFHNTRARALTLSGQLAGAEAAYRAAWASRPNTPEIANNLGCLLQSRGDVEGAEQWLCQASMLAPGSGDVAGNLADVLAAKGAHAASLMQFQHALLLSPNAPGILCKFARLLLLLGRFGEAEDNFRTAARLRPGHAATHNDLGLAMQAQGRNEAAMQCFREALRHDPNSADAHHNLGCLLLLDQQLDEARACQERALEADGLHGAALWARCMVELPVVYETAAGVALQRARYAQQLAALAAKAGDPAVSRALAAAAGASQPFFLPYQGACDRALQAVYGTLLARVLQSGAPPPNQSPAAGEAVRVGIVSGHFCEHTVWHLMLKGWLSQIDPGRFSVHAYHTAAADDDQTALARRLCERFPGGRFVGGPGVDVRAEILADRPQVLLYPELGMDPVAARLAGERLAPVQCVSWGQPETSGLPTMDFFLSSTLMEPDDARSHYTERLVPLPNLGIHYMPDSRQPEKCTRAELGLREGAMIFWCGQALYKYLPQHDDVFARIAAEIGDCQFLFIAFAKSRAVTECVRARLRQAFAARGLDADHHCVFLAPMSQERFLGSAGLAEIVLDSIGWSGGKSTLDLLAGAPVIVTHAGPLMRGRHTMAILTRIGVTETIVATVDAYVDAAVGLARDPARRSALRARMAAGRHRLMADAAPIRALETFLDGAVAEQRTAAALAEGGFAPSSR